MVPRSFPQKVLWATRKNARRSLIAYSLAGTALALEPISEDLRLLISLPILFIIPGYSLLVLFKLRSRDPLQDLTYSSVLSLAFVAQGAAVVQVIGNTSTLSTFLDVASVVLLVLSSLTGKKS